MPATFPLLRLPIDERLAVLRQMRTKQLFVLSLISKRAKSLVASSNRKARAVVVSVELNIQFSCEMFQEPGFDVELYIWEAPNEPTKVKKPSYMTILKKSPNDTPIKFWKEEYDVKDWLEHLCQIFHRRFHNLLVGRHGFRYNLDSVYENFKNPFHLGFPGTGNADYDNRVLKMIIPKTSIFLNSGNFETGRPPKDILIQNYDSFGWFANFQQLAWTRPLDDLLCANSREISTDVSGFSEKDINKFLKLWIHGANPRLQLLLIFHAAFNYDNVLRGIQNCVLPEDQENVFKSYTVAEDIVLKGGREIQRKDGAVGKVVLNNIRGAGVFNFFVSHE